MNRTSLAFVTSAGLTLSLMTGFVGADCPRTDARLGYGPSDAVAVGGAFAAVGAGEVVVTVDLTDELQPVRVGELRLKEKVADLEWVGGAVVASTWSHLSVIAVDHEGSPTLLHQIAMTAGRRHLAAVGSTLWTMDWSSSGGTTPSELTAFDLSVPEEPELLGVFSITSYATDLAVSGELAFLADQFAGLRILDVSDPGAVAELSSLPIDGAWRVEASSDLAVVASQQGELTVVDLRIPTSPQLLGTAGSGRYASPFALKLRDERLYVGSVACDPHICPPDGGLSIFDMSEPATPELIGSVDFDSGAMDLAWLGDRLLAADHEAGLRVVSVDDDHAPRELARLNPGLDQAFAVQVVGDIALVADHGLRVLDLGGGSDLRLVAGLELDAVAFDLAFDHSQQGRSVAAYLGSDGTLSLIAVDDPGDPELIAELPHQQASGVAMDSGRLAVADGDAGLWLLDLADPGEPADLGHFPLPGAATAVAMSEDEIVVAYEVQGGGNAGIVRFLVDDGGGCWQAFSLAVGRKVVELELAGDQLVAAVGADLVVFDLSDRTSYAMVELARIEEVYAQRLAVNGPMVYASCWPGVLTTVDLRDPLEPLLAGRSVWQFPIADGGPQGGWDVASYGELAVVADGEFGVRVMDAASCRCGRRDPDYPPTALD